LKKTLAADEDFSSASEVSAEFVALADETKEAKSH
jgi:hypothetical protein